MDAGASVLRPSSNTKVRAQREGRESRGATTERYPAWLRLDAWQLGTVGLLCALAPGIIHVLYANRYQSAGTLLQILSFSLTFARFNVFNTAYAAIGTPEYQAPINILRLAAIAILLPVLLNPYGLEGLVYAVVLHPTATLPLHYWRIRKLSLLDLKYEFMVLPAWPADYLVGLATVQFFQLVLR